MCAINKILVGFSLTVLHLLYLGCNFTHTDDLEISDNLLLSAYHKGKKTTKISYNDTTREVLKGGIKKNSTLFSHFNTTKKDVISTNQAIEANNSSFVVEEDTDLMKSVNENTIFSMDFRELYSFLRDKGSGTDFFKGSSNQERLTLFMKKHMKRLYNVNTEVEFTIKDLVSLINDKIINESQAISIWEFLLNLKASPSNIKELKSLSKSDKLLGNVDYKFGYTDDQDNNEPWRFSLLFNNFSIKSILIFVKSVIVFLWLYKFHRIKMAAGKRKNKLNSFFIVSTLTYCYLLYSWEYFVSCSIFFLFFCLTLRYSVESVFIQCFGLEANDIDIGKESQTEKLFFCKLMIMIACILIISILIYFVFPHFITYILFYGLIIKLLNFIIEYIQPFFSDKVQPINDLLYFLFGFSNCLLTNIHRNYKCNPFEQKVDSFYIASDLFTFVTISNLLSYIKIQSLDLKSITIVYETEEEKDEKLKKINNAIDGENRPAIDINKNLKDFTLNDILWLLVFMVGAILYFVNINSSNYVGLCLAMNFQKNIFRLFGGIFKTKATRIAKSLFLFFHLLSITISTSKSDHQLLSVLELDDTWSEILKFLVKFIGLVYTIYIIVTNYEYIYLFDDQIKQAEDNSCHSEVDYKKFEITSNEVGKRKKKLRTIEIYLSGNQNKFRYLNILYVSIEFTLNYILISLIIYLIYNHERFLIIKITYDFFLLIFLIRVS